MTSQPMSVLDHIYLDVSDYERSKAFFARALAPLGIELVMERDRVAGFGRAQKPELWIRSAQVRPADLCGSTTRQTLDEASVISPIHVAIGATSRDEVEIFYREALAAGGRDNGAPGLHREYHPTYYGAFVLDPDGHNLEAVSRTGSRRRTRASAGYSQLPPFGSPGEVASTYVRLRLGQDATMVNRARLEVYALTGRENVMGDLTRHATARIDALRQQWGVEVDQKSAAKQTQYRRILRQAPTPSDRFVKVSGDMVVDRGTVAYDKHVFVDEAGRAPIKFTSSWERETLPDIIDDATTVAWLRNPSRSDWGLCLPRREGNAYHPSIRTSSSSETRGTA